MSVDISPIDPCAAYVARLDQLLALSERMLSLARGGNWASVTEAQARYQSLMGALGEVSGLALEQDDGRVQLIRTRLKAILDLNTEMMGLGHEARKALSGQIRTIADGQSARRAYLQNNG